MKEKRTRIDWRRGEQGWIEGKENKDGYEGQENKDGLKERRTRID